MTTASRQDLGGFGEIVSTLVERVTMAFADSPESERESVAISIATNSSLVVRRGEPLVAILEASDGGPSVVGSRIADLGCGFGALSAYFAFRGASVVGIDPNEDRLAVGRAVAEQHGLDVSLAGGSFEATGLQDESFDIAVANNSLCYVVEEERRRRALAEITRILRPGGLLVLCNPNRGHPLDQFTGLPLLHLLGPEAANRLAGRLGRQRSRVRLSTTVAAVHELRRTGFADVHSVDERGRPAPVRRFFARYQYLRARRDSTAAR